MDEAARLKTSARAIPAVVLAVLALVLGAAIAGGQTAAPDDAGGRGNAPIDGELAATLERINIHDTPPEEVLDAFSDHLAQLNEALAENEDPSRESVLQDLIDYQEGLIALLCRQESPLGC